MQGQVFFHKARSFFCHPKSDSLKHSFILLEVEFEVCFTHDFRGPNLFGIAVEDRGGVFIAKGFEQAERLHEVECKISKIDVGI